MMKIDLKIRLFLLAAMLLHGCSPEQQALVEEKPSATDASFKVVYTIPDMETPDATGTRAYVEDIVGGGIDKLLLLFFENKEDGSGKYMGKLKGDIEGLDLIGSGKVVVDYSTSPINNDTDYRVLFIANADTYFADFDFDAFCAKRTEDDVKHNLKGDMPRTTPGSSTFTLPNRLLMTATGTKRAGEEMKIELLRAAVRVDVGVNESADLSLMSAMLGNVSSTIPLFAAVERNLPVTPIIMDEPYPCDEEFPNWIKGYLFLTEVYHTVNTPKLLYEKAACLLVSCKKKDYTGNKTWYRINLNVNAEGVQELRRNYAYRVFIKNIWELGEETPEAALKSKANLGIEAVLVPADWTPGNPGTPPAVEVH